MVRAMFPDIPVAAIQADLQRTGSVETTVDNARRDGGLPLVHIKKIYKYAKHLTAATTNNIATFCFAYHYYYYYY